MALFGGTVLKLSNKTYSGNGTMVVDTSDPDKDTFRLVLDSDPAELANQSSVTFKVEKKQ